MRPLALLALLVVPLLALAQDESGGGDDNVQVSTILSTSVGENDGQETTQIISSVVTITASANDPQSSNSTSNSNSTDSGNSTSSSGNNTSSSSSRSPLPTATASVDGGGGGSNGAPSPGASSNSGIFGPDDSYISAALDLSATTLVSLAAGIIGGVCLVWT